MTKLMEAFLQNLRVYRANRKKAIFNKHENNHFKSRNVNVTEKMTFEPWHEISNNVVCATSKGSDQPAHTRSLMKAFASRLNIL